MIITDDSVSSLTGYRILKEGAAGTLQLVVANRPEACPDCGATLCFWVRSYYFRWAVEGEIEEIIPVPRYTCKECGLTVTVLYSFLVPYRQFTGQIVAAGVQQYIQEFKEYRDVAGEIAAENLGDEDMQRPNHSQVWFWVEAFASKCMNFLAVLLQRTCVEAGLENQLTGLSEVECPNAVKSHTKGKEDKLNIACRVLAFARLLGAKEDELVLSLQTHFASFVQTPFSILTGRADVALAPQSSHHSTW